MTPAARVQASIEILDAILAGAPVEKALTNWARRSRFAGSKDRAAVRDHVFAALRCKRSFAALGGAETGRGLMIGAVRASEDELGHLFSGERHAPSPVAEDESSRAFSSDAERFDIPEWLWPRFQASLGDQAATVAEALQSRAPVHLRVNLLKSDVENAIAALEAEGIRAVAHPACDTALEVTEGARKISKSRAYADGLVELQDAASQAVVAAVRLTPGMRVLDYCAGGGGKSLALAATEGVDVFAHDVNAARMRDLPNRAERAGARVSILSTNELSKQGPFDIVLADAPCSGSGSWRRAPAGKWALTEARLNELTDIQTGILSSISGLVSTGGILAYATCSMLADENGAVVDAFLKDNPNWSERFRKTWLVSHGTDGFFTSHLTR
ncbi:RsmB/NOP family class I SAM-dependent RNA methyltransferase [Ruegeria sp.]|uniref:RsmB/NOP family class I SAM-dependent RNA methyltransferase n=1 Tax=Ruegeria sp. TaxID=1879320 RepID=UPI003B58EE47